MSRKKQEIPQETKDLIVNLFVNEGITFKEISSRTGIPSAKVSALIKKWGVEDPRKTILAKFNTKDSLQDRGMLAAQIYKKFPEPEFWEIMRLPFEINSLKYFLSEEGVRYIESYIREFKTPQQERKILKPLPNKIGEDFFLYKKPTRKDFLT